MLQKNFEEKSPFCKSTLTSFERVIIALDLNDINEVRDLISKVGNTVSTFKVGMRLFTKYGPSIINELKDKGYEIFLDMKYHDIPNTVETACREAAMLGVKMMTIHALGGKEMSRSAVKGAIEGANIVGSKVPIVLGVTILTSMDENELLNIGIKDKVEDSVLNLAKLVTSEGVTGIVCSPLEVKKIKQNIKNFVAVTPGIRLDSDNKNDQKRIATPESAIRDGADYLVIGRPVYGAKNPKEVLKNIYESIDRIIKC